MEPVEVTSAQSLVAVNCHCQYANDRVKEYIKLVASDTVKLAFINDQLPAFSIVTSANGLSNLPVSDNYPKDNLPMTLSNTDRLAMLKPPTGTLRVVMDTDTFNEIDDQFAIVQMMLSVDRLSVEAIYAAPFHNARSTDPGHGMELSYDEILRLLTRINVSPSGLVHKGVTAYVGTDKIAREAEAVDDLIARARSGTKQEPLYVIAIAAISNVASALLKAPDILDKIVVIWLGGHGLDWPHTREFNLRQDVGGAQVLFDSGVPLVLVPCKGVASHLHSTVPEIDTYVKPQGDIGSFLALRFKEYTDDPKGWSKEIWDMAAVAWTLDADWAPSILTHSPILSDNATWSFDQSRHLIRYVTEVDRDAIMRDFIAKLEGFVAG